MNAAVTFAQQYGLKPGVALTAAQMARVSIQSFETANMNLAGAEVRSAGDASLNAGRDLNLDSITTGRSEEIRWSKKNARTRACKARRPAAASAAPAT